METFETQPDIESDILTIIGLVGVYADPTKPAGHVELEVIASDDGEAHGVKRVVIGTKGA